MVMAEIYVNCGKYDEALDELEAVLSQKSFVTTNTLKFSKWLDPVRQNPRYKSLIEQYALAQ